MLFSPPTQHALRALIYLAQHEAGVPVHARDIARAEKIPRAFLSKILNRLRTRGILKSVMGPSGGYTLAKPARDIRIYDVVATFDDVQEMNRHCLLGLGDCNASMTCGLHAHWTPFRDGFYQWISQTSLADVAAPVTPPAPKRQRPRKAVARAPISRAVGSRTGRRRAG
jgi:Rrf2 family protein